MQAKVAYDLRPNQRLSLFVLSSRERTDALFDEESSPSSLGFGNEASNNLVSLTLTSTWGSRLSSRTIGPRSATSGRARSLCCRRLASTAGSDQGGEGADPRRVLRPLAWKEGAVANDDFDKGLRDKVAGYSGACADHVLLVPDLLLLNTRLMLDPPIEGRHKVDMGAALAYVISPLDL